MRQLALSVLLVAGCVTEMPPVTSPTPSPRPHSIAEATRPPTVTAWPRPTEEYPSVAQRPPPHSVAEGTRPPTWTAWPRPTEEYPSVAQLKVWRNAVGEEGAGQLRGLVWSSLDERNKRIKIGLLPLRGVRAQWEAAIARAKVPREAFEIEVGCRGGALWRLETGTDPGRKFRRAIDYSVEAVPQADYGETVLMTLKLRNGSYWPVRFDTGGIPPHDFVISNGGGEEVWNWKCGKVIAPPLNVTSLQPGEELEFVGEWEQVNNRGEPVPPGTYFIRGALNMEPPERLLTPPRKLQVLR